MIETHGTDNSVRCTRRVGWPICAAMLLAFAVLSYTAVTTKNSTYDETLHIPAGWMNLRGDFRANPEHPPLWKYWSALPALFWPIDTSQAAQYWAGIPNNPSLDWKWCIRVMYRTADNNADAIVNHARFMMMLVALGLGIFLTSFAWKVGGVVAGVAAATLYCFDPNFTAHGSLVTNDVAISFCMLALIFSLWRVGQETTWRRIAAVGFFCGLGIIVKFSGLLFGPMILLVLLIRAVMGDWRVLGRTLKTYSARILASIGICIFAGLLSYLMIWAVYQFRYSAVPGGDQPLAWNRLIELAQSNELYSRHPGFPVTEKERQSWHPSLITGGLLYANTHHLLPEAFCFGVLHVHMGELVRPGYLLGQISRVGWWYYFPLAALFKTPMATLVAMFAAALLIWQRRRIWWANPERRWLTIAVGVPTLIYIAVLMQSNLDLGLRHLLPAYLPAYLIVALVVASVWRNRKNASRIFGGLLAAALIVESVAAWPNYIPFFNWASGGSRGGLYLLGDSNLDWGQDLKGLAQWQKEHENTRLYFLYFGTADPAYYHIHYINLPGGYLPGPPFQVPTGPGVIAASATVVQGIYLDDTQRAAYAWMMHATPIKVLGGSIYLFQYQDQGKSEP